MNLAKYREKINSIPPPTWADEEWIKEFNEFKKSV